MFKFLRTFKKWKKHNSWEYADDFDKDQHGGIIVPIKLKTLDDISEKYYINGYREISSNFYNSVDNIVENLPVKSKYNFQIEFIKEKNSMQELVKPADSEKEKNNLIKSEIVCAFKHHYLLKAIALERKKKRNVMFGISFIVASMLLLLTFLLLTLFPVWLNIPGYDNEPVSLYDVGGLWELIDIFAWVLCWEGFDRLCFEIPEQNMEQIRNYNLYYSKFKFVKVNKNKIISNVPKPATPGVQHAEAMVSTFDRLKNIDARNLAKEEKKAQKMEQKTNATLAPEKHDNEKM